MSYDGQMTLKELLEDLNLAGVFRVIEILKTHPEVVSIEVKTKEQAIAEVKGEQ